MKLAVITTCYNHAEFLDECLASVASQTAKCLHVVVDDASPDRSRAKIVQYAAGDPARRRAVLLDQNVGLAGAFHAGVAAVPDEIEWLLKVDADDKIDARYVACILRASEEDPRRNVIFAPCQHFGKRSDIYVYREYDSAKIIDQFMIPGPAAYRRSLWDAVGGYDRTMRSAEDWDFYIRAERAVGLVPYQIRNERVYWWYRMHDGHRASSEGIALLPDLQRYWRGHTKANVGQRSWGAWLEQETAPVQ